MAVPLELLDGGRFCGSGVAISNHERAAASGVGIHGGNVNVRAVQLGATVQDVSLNLFLCAHTADRVPVTPNPKQKPTEMRAQRTAPHGENKPQWR
jgi:hypothetical protein